MSQTSLPPAPQVTVMSASEPASKGEAGKPLSRLAELLYRTPTEAPLTSPERRRDLLAHYALFAVLFGCAAIGYVALQLLDKPLRPPMEALPHALFAANLGLAAAFFGTWLTRRDRHEYYYFAVYGAACSFLQLRLLSLFEWGVRPSDRVLLDTFVIVGEGGFGLLMALTFARTRLAIVNLGVPFLVGIPMVVQTADRVLSLGLSVNRFLALVYTPALYTLGTVACLVQALHLLRHVPSAVASGRVHRLFVFAVAMFAMTCLSALYHPPLLFRAPQLGLLVLMSALALLEYPPRASSHGTVSA
ncbi:MAG: hypothetical protein INH41_06790 [Myxococcaceae bacterium]|jgi:hypothetical protein|nr:hypothetical protein [Myxococcaceae bacterium]MCA3012096.1 hypothetical protein [Myxococcaceae bacterium]